MENEVRNNQEWVSLSDLVLPVVSRWRTALICFAAGVCLALLISWFIPNKWETRRTLAVFGSPGEAMIGGFVATGPATRALSVVRSDVVRTSIRSKFNLSNPQFDTIFKFQLNDSENTIEIAAELHNREKAVEMVNSVTDAVLELSNHIAREQSKAALDNLLEVRRSQGLAMAGIAKSTFSGLQKPGAGMAVDLTSSADLFQEIVRTNAELTSIRSQLAVAEELERAANRPGSADATNTSLRSLEDQLVLAKLEAAQLARSNGAESPQLVLAQMKVEELKEAIKAVRTSVDESTRTRTSSTLRPLVERSKALESKQKSLQGSLEELSGNGATTWMDRMLLEAEGEALKATRIAEQEQLILIAARLNRFVPVGPAVTLDEPVNKTFPKLIRNGLLGGIGLASLVLMVLHRQHKRKGT